MVPEFSNAVTQLKPGQFSEPVRTQFGWHVILLNGSRQESIPSLNQVRKEQKAILLEERIKSKFNETRDQVVVRAFIDEDPIDAFRQDRLLEQ